MKQTNKTARFIEKTDIRATLMSFSVGDELLIKDKQSRYATIKTTIAGIEKKENRKYIATIKGIPDGTIVRRMQ